MFKKKLHPFLFLSLFCGANIILKCCLLGHYYSIILEFFMGIKKEICEADMPGWERGGRGGMDLDSFVIFPKVVS